MLTVPAYRQGTGRLLAFAERGRNRGMNTRSRASPRKILQQRRSRFTVDAIIEAAALLLAARGWEASTTNHIAARAGVSIGDGAKP
jgi:hypothetical protein